MGRLWFALLVTGAVLGAGCASPGTGRRVCGGRPIDAAYLAGGPVYRECQVDRRAELASPPPRPELPRPVSPTDVREGCVRAEVEFVVDEEGVPVPEPVRVIRSTSAALADALVRAVPRMRFRPALRDGRPVRQLVRFGMGYGVVVRRSGGAGTAGMSPMDLPRSCR